MLSFVRQENLIQQGGIDMVGKTVNFLLSYPLTGIAFALAFALSIVLTDAARSSAGESGYSISSHEIEVRVDIKKRSIEGADTLTLVKTEKDAGPEVPLYLRAGSDVGRAEVEGAEARFST